MTTVEVTKTPSKYVTVTKTSTISTVSKPLEGVLEVHDPGVAGPPNTLTLGSVTSGATAAVSITGTAPTQTINFVLPVGGNYTHTQSTASSTWTITHNLGFSPAVSVVDSGGNHVIGDVNYVSVNVLTISFSAPFGGSAYLS
jgi:hypothetical protein